ncbi:MAG: protein kinase, partial [Planctomycetes bacterium]|nr:protein kinase [Planctomycetota bacterium]
IFAEKKGILHRDIKPDNFMLGQDGSVKLCDLGLAKKSESADLLAQGIIGTPHFIAPEAIRRKTEVDARADLYSLGCAFFRLLTGKNPYPAPSVKEILLAHLNAPVPRAAAAVKDLPKELDEIVARLMQKEPAARYQSATELWSALDKVRLQFGLEAHGLHPGRAKKLAILGGLVAVAAVAALIVMKPWEEKVKTETVVVEKPGSTGDPAMSAKEKQRLEAKAKLGEIENQALRDLGKLEESWSKPGWRGIADAYDGLATDYAGTDEATEAGRRAKDIRTYVEKRVSAKKAYDDAVRAAEKEVRELVAKGAADAKGLVEAGKFLEAEKALDAARDAAKKVGETTHEGQRVLTPDEVKGASVALDAARAGAVSALQAAWTTFERGVDEKAAPGTAEALDTAIAELTAWERAHPDAGPGGDVAHAWNDSLRAAGGRRSQLEKRRDAALRADLVADRAAYYTWLAKETYAPRADDGTGGGMYLRFRFGEAADRAAARVKTAKTAAYRELFAAREREARLLAALPGVLASGFAQKGFKDKLAGAGWSGPVKGITPEGVQVADRLRPFSDEGLGWFYDLFFEKGQERYPLDADAFEALGCLAEAAGVLEQGARFDAAAASWRRAAELDPARAERLTARAARAEAEKTVRALLDTSADLVADAVREMGKLEEKLAGTDLKASEAARKEVLEREPVLRKQLADAKDKLAEAERGFASTVVRALLVDAAPEDSAYAGEKLPEAPVKPPTPPAAPAMDGAPPAPAMDGAPPTPPAGAAMGEGDAK